ncbi:MAG: hypothetical protein WCJ74_02235 [bacterium]
MTENTKIQMEALRSLGMIHVTGLPMHYEKGSALNGRIISAHRRYWGQCGSNNGMLVAILETGEVFLSAFSNDLHNTIVGMCSKGTGAGVPCSNGEMVHGYHLLNRSVDPMWHGNGSSYEFHADPEQAEYAAERWEQTRRDKELKFAKDGYRITLTAVPHPA